MHGAHVPHDHGFELRLAHAFEILAHHRLSLRRRAQKSSRTAEWWGGRRAPSLRIAPSGRYFRRRFSERRRHLRLRMPTHARISIQIMKPNVMPENTAVSKMKPAFST